MIRQDLRTRAPPELTVVLPLVLLPGLMCDERLFAPQVAAFSGERAVQVGCLTTADNVGDMARSVLSAAPEQFALAGLSLGGIVAMEVVRQAPERVQRLALMDTNPLPEPPDVATVRAAQIERVKSGALVEVMRDELKPHYLVDGPRRAAVLEVCMEMAMALGADVFVHQARAISGRADQRATLRRFSVPTMILTGESDALCPMDRHTLMHDLIDDASLIVVPGAGHLPTLEQPDLTTEAMRTWLVQH